MPYADPEQRRQWFRERRHEMRTMIDEAKNKACVVCGIQFHFAAMQFDHVRGVKKFDMAYALSAAKSLEALVDEIAKCDVICANCHAVKSHNQRESIVNNRWKRTESGPGRSGHSLENCATVMNREGSTPSLSANL